MHGHVKGAYVDPESNTVHLKVVTLTGHSPKGKDKCERKNGDSKVKPGGRKEA